jgi:hypothetical protein
MYLHICIHVADVHIPSTSMRQTMNRCVTESVNPDFGQQENILAHPGVQWQSK